ncbi:MAG: methylated-DNA--[protein]-cysteine S-methyltransferase [Desulfovibrionaceae bacterium]|nr:methylated-DNA--[protein]-cysteine S-methyltransferase [Desulfovibrionaceae bacterium]
MNTCVIASPVGEIFLREEDGALIALDFAAAPERSSPSSPLLREAADQLAAYFAGRLRSFSLPLRPSGTPFMLRVWEELRRIPYGRTASYKDIAIASGHPLAFRAVGQANHRNPLSIFIPCHRVIAHDGSLAGYGGGLEIKKHLLRLEGVRI